MNPLVLIALGVVAFALYQRAHAPGRPVGGTAPITSIMTPTWPYAIPGLTPPGMGPAPDPFAYHILPVPFAPAPVAGPPSPPWFTPPTTAPTGPIPIAPTTPIAPVIIDAGADLLPDPVDTAAIYAS